MSPVEAPVFAGAPGPSSHSGLAPQYRHDGWTAERRVRFLDALAACGCVRTASAQVGLSPQSAYLLRRRCGLFASGWDAALLLARPIAEEALMTRALHGTTETIFYRGEAVGHRTRFDSRLLLALLDRLDLAAEDERAQGAARAFDTLLADVAAGDGLAPGEAWEPPLTRAEEQANAAQDAWPDPFSGKPLSRADCEEREALADDLRAAAGEAWDADHAEALAAVDAVCGSVCGTGEAGGAIEYKSLDGPGEERAEGRRRDCAPARQHRQLRRRRAIAVPVVKPGGNGHEGGRGRGDDTSKGSLSMRSILFTAAAASAALAFAATPAAAQSGTMLKAMMTGAAEVPGPGMKGATGQASVMAYPDTGYVCWSIATQNAGDATMAHIHKGAMGVAGDPVVPLDPPMNGMGQGCKQVDKAVAADIAANPAGYYVNVHTAAYPKGALRGQLMM